MSSILFTVVDLPNTPTDEVSLQVEDVADLRSAIKEKMQPALNNYAEAQLMLKVKRRNEPDNQAQDLNDPTQYITYILQQFGNDCRVLVFLPPIIRRFEELSLLTSVPATSHPVFDSFQLLDQHAMNDIIYGVIMDSAKLSQCGLPIVTTKICDIEACRILGTGFNAVVFEACATKTKQMVVLKYSIEDNLLKREAQILKQLGGLKDIPKLLHESVNSEIPYIVTSMVGQKITEVDVPKACLIIADILKVLKNLHEHGYIHNDIHPGNIVDIGGKFKLIDFGRAVQRSGKRDIIPAKWPEGHITFASHNRGKYLGPGDDLEALCYTIAFMYNRNKKYWRAAARDPYNAIHQKEEKPFYLFDGLPQVFRDFYYHVYDLDITALPDYEYWQQQFRQSSLNSYALPKKHCPETPPKSVNHDIESERRTQPRTEHQQAC